jgi:glycosyltransferase involved in cell wall biosynthesis
MKKIYLDFHGKKHSLYDNLINYPPNGYEFITGITPLSKFTKSASSIGFLPNLLMRSINRLMPISILKPYLERNSKLPSDINLIYSSGHVIFKDIPWVVDLEFVTHLGGYGFTLFKRYKEKIKKSLESENCKKIMPWTDAGKKTILLTFDSDIIREKTETVYLSVPPKNFVKEYNKDKIKILFVGSQNLPKDFEIKGGKEVFEGFNILNKQYKNLELTARSYLPKRIKAKYSKFRNVKIIDQIIPWDVLEEEFKSADIFLFPSHNTPGLAILDAMSYELPVITTDVWANPELVNDGKNGFVIRKSDKIQYYTENFVPNWSSTESLKMIEKMVDPEVVKELVEKTSVLIEDTNLRRKMGMAGRQEIEIGKFSIERRNEKLKNVFDEAIEITAREGMI